MFQSLLFPTDFSPFNERLARCLPDLKRLGIEEIVLLNVVEMGHQIGFASDTFESMLAWKKDAEPRLLSLKAQIESQGLQSHWRLELGKPALEIVRVADLERANIHPFAWVINQSFLAAGTKDPVLAERGRIEARYIDEVRTKHADRVVMIPWKTTRIPATQNSFELAGAGVKQ